MLLLKSNEKYDELLKLDPESGAVEVASRKTSPRITSIQGHFARQNDDFVCLYRWQDKLAFRVANRAYEIPDNAIAELRDQRERRTLRILAGGQELCQWTYSKPQRDIIDALRDIEEEESDFGLFVHNVINDKERQRRMYTSQLPEG
jgi:hypothetical protein